MIRGDDGQTAFYDLYNFYVSRREKIRRWLYSATKTVVGVSTTSAVIAFMEARLGKALSREHGMATAWIVNGCIDIEEKLRRHEDLNRGVLTQMALDDAYSVAQSRAIRDYTGLGPHAAAQLGVMAEHIHTHHL